MTPARDDVVEKIRERINARLVVVGLSGREASRRAGLGISYINDLLSGKSKSPSANILHKLADVLDCDAEYLLVAQDEPRSSKVAIQPSPKAAEPMPLYSITLTDPDGYFPMRDADTSGFLPDAILNGTPFLYAVTIGDDLMSPRFLPGEIVCVNTRKPVSVGTFALVRLNNGRAVIRQISGIFSDVVELVALKDGSHSTVQRSDIQAIHRITATFDS